MSERESKFNVDKDKSKRTFDNIVFDSEMEMKFYRDVVLPYSDSGQITYYELQKKYDLQPAFKYNDIKQQAIRYVADFYLEYSDGKSVIIDIKGHADPVAKLKRKMFWYKYPDTDYRWITYSKIDGGWVDWDYVQKQRNKRRKDRLEAKQAKLEGEDKNGEEREQDDQCEQVSEDSKGEFQ